MASSCAPLHVGFGSASIVSCNHMRGDGIRTTSHLIRLQPRSHLRRFLAVQTWGAFTIENLNLRPRMPPFSSSDRWRWRWHEPLLAQEASFSALEAVPHLPPTCWNVERSCGGATRPPASRLASSIRPSRFVNFAKKKNAIVNTFVNFQVPSSSEPFVNFLSSSVPPSIFEVNFRLTEVVSVRRHRFGISIVSSWFWRTSATFVASRSTWTRPFRPCPAKEATRKVASASWK